MKPDETLNVYSKSDDWRARRLSNFSPDSFLLDGESLASVEGFIQGIKFPEGHLRRLLAFRSAGITAKRLGINIAPDSVWWKHQPIPYGSAEHRNLIERAIRAKYEQNSEAKDALLATKGMALTHELDEPDSISLPREIFCCILMKIREEFLKTMHNKTTDI